MRYLKLEKKMGDMVSLSGVVTRRAPTRLKGVVQGKWSPNVDDLLRRKTSWDVGEGEPPHSKNKITKSKTRKI